MNNDKQIQLIEVFAGSSMQAYMVKSLLENVEIEVFLKDENIGRIVPFQAAPGGAGAVKVFVSDTDLNIARQIVAEYEYNINNNK